MALIGEMVYRATVTQFDEDTPLTYSWTFESAPRAVLAKVCLTDSWDRRDQGDAATGITRMRRRLPDNTDETINFGQLWTYESEKAVFDRNLTSVTFAVLAAGGIAKALWIIDFWS